MSLAMQPPELRCEVCGSSFHRREHYQRHLRTHTRERPFSCAECGQGFSRVDSLARHHETIHGQGLQQSGKSGTGRRRVSRACRPCRISKLRCDGQQPCHRCRDHDIDCVYGANRCNRSSNASPDTIPSKRARRKTSGLDPPEHSSEPPRSMEPSCLDFGFPGGMETAGVGGESRHSVPDLLSTWDVTNTFGSQSTEFANLLDLDFSAALFETGPFVQRLDDFCFASTQPQPHQLQSTISESLQSSSAPLTPEAVTQIYDRSRSPDADERAPGPLQYRPSVNNDDAPVHFPIMDHVSSEDIDQENLAHVDEVPATVLDNAMRLAKTMQTTPTFPMFSELRIPPMPVINAWVQLYFEYFHSVFPFLHKPSFRSPEAHWLLIFTVSAIGAQFSNLPQARACGRTMQELVRRQGAYICENRNVRSRELWLVQMVVLNQLALRYCGNRRALELAELLQALPAMLARRKRLFHNTMSSEKISHLDLPRHQKWQVWTFDEQRRRAGFAIWLMDSAFQSHFDLPSMIPVHEMHNTWPRAEDLWGASTAEAWATFPDRQVTLDLPCDLRPTEAKETWSAIWRNTGVLGKQTLIQQLLNMVEGRNCRGQPFQDSVPDQEPIQEILQHLLSIIESETEGVSAMEVKALGVYRANILLALMLSNAPRIPSFSYAIKLRTHTNHEELAISLCEWTTSPRARKSILYAAGIVETVRTHFAAHFSTPSCLFKATLALWFYSASTLRSQVSQASDAPSVVLGLSDKSHPVVSKWIETGYGRVKLPEVGSLVSPVGLQSLLDRSILLLNNIKAWGVGEIYAQLLGKLCDH